jgi:AraC family transcriptional regulator of adaptative response/methylated-DNA-[protein]-cysteine methyltransferase
MLTTTPRHSAKLSIDRWGKVCARDPDADGEFVFAVRTTGIFCRPSCPSRRPKPENVVFYDINKDAENAGFRACKRCRPQEISSVQQHSLAIEAACRKLELPGTSPSLDDLADQAGLSKFHFQRVFKASTGVTPKQYHAAVLQNRIRTALTSTSTVTDAIYASGHETASRFYDAAIALLGMTPSTYQAGAKGEVIVYGFARCSVGTVSVAFSRKGVCAVRLNDTSVDGVAELRTLFPKAILVLAEGGIEELIHSITDNIEEPLRSADLPLEIRGTAFQHRVWRALQKIPVGSTATYKDIADAIGAPKSSRAVAQACVANPVAVLIPCHRVVRADGQLSGYRWGVERKRQLLDREAAV